MGKNKSDVIDSEVLTHVGEIFEPPPLVLASPGQLALRRAVVRRSGVVIDGTGTGVGSCRWRGGPFLMRGLRSADPSPQPLAVLGRWPHLRSLASARAG